MLARAEKLGASLAPFLFALALVLGVPGTACAEDLINQTTDGGVAIDGYDPVAYFLDGKPVKGSEAFVHEWLGATWQFSSAAHRDLFAADPVRYAPQYGGYCSSGMEDGVAIGADPEAWRIVDGRLYLFASKDGMALWALHAPGRIAKADGQWEKLSGGLSE